MKKQTVVAFLDISGAYDNVLIDVLCGVMLEKELPLEIVRFMWSLLWCKTLVFCVWGAECMNLTGFKGLPQGSVLSPFLYNLLGSGMDRYVPSGCDFFQYADDIVMYSSLWCLGSDGLNQGSRYPLQSRRWYCSFGGNCSLRSRSGLMTDYCHKWWVSSI
jgi:hypothetical protein